MPVDLHQGPIDPQNNVHQNMLRHLQGNILKPHGRSHAVHIFLKFKADKDAVRRWMRPFAQDYVTSAEQQRKESSDFSTHRTLRLFGNLFLSASGYAALGYAEADIQHAFAVAQEDRERHLTLLEFSHGMQAQAHDLNDPDPQTWEPEYRDQKIDAMILLADTDEAFMLRQAETVLETVAAVADVLAIERGHVLRNNAGDAVEPFGYVDGISNPHFLQDTQAAPTMWNPAAHLDLVLLPDPFAKTPLGEALPDCCGSYLVFRKLEQNLREFRQRIQQLACTLQCSADMAHALVLGRFKDGTPLTSFDTAGMGPISDFNYSQDPDGARCPFHAHIRRLNPREESAVNLATLADNRAERRHQIARRSIPYGVSSEVTRDDYPAEQLPTGKAGILFMCFQRSLSNQFGFLQIEWASSGTKSGSQVPIGVDPIIGKPSANQRVTEQRRWPQQWGELRFTPFNFQGFVTLKGGEFLFAPSLPFFQHL